MEESEIHYDIQWLENFTNAKDSLAHAGQDICKRWTGFTVGDIREQVGLCALADFLPSPTM